MIKKVLLGSLTLIVLLCVGFGLWLYFAVNKPVDENFLGVCTDLNLEGGSAEDIQIDRARGLAYLSISDRMATAKGEDPGPGDIGRLDLNMNPPNVGSALTDGPDLKPHGLSLFIDEKGQRHLYVINHWFRADTGEERIEYFRETTPGLFSHVQTLESPLITRANDMVAVGPDSFYVAQDVDRRGGQTLTDLVYYNGSEYLVVADDIKSGGGINVSADGQTLFIAETGGKRIRVANLNPDDGTIMSDDYIDLGTAPDNIDIAEDGFLWVGAHSNVVALAMHFIAGSNSPTQILKVGYQGGNSSIEEVYLNSGTQISSGSGGATLGDTLLIGSITAKKILVCDMKQP
ncbi:MAG: SMP-30/gluconolactonase/LRE family protein [Gammaproteobacteria bacterium]